MNIIEALKSKKIRIDSGRRWLVWDTDDNTWVVREQKYAQKYARVICITEYEEAAVKSLLYEDED